MIMEKSLADELIFTAPSTQLHETVAERLARCHDCSGVVFRFMVYGGLLVEDGFQKFADFLNISLFMFPKGKTHGLGNTSAVFNGAFSQVIAEKPQQRVVFILCWSNRSPTILR